MIKKIIEEYINKAPVNEPILTTDIYNYVLFFAPNLDKARFNLYMQRFEKNREDLKRFQKGIYYKAANTPFGNTHINKQCIIKAKYLNENNNIIGYETGPSLMNNIGLTTQMPALTYIATNKARYHQVINDLQICIVKPVVFVREENYRYLQFLDILDNKFKVNIEADNYYGILRNLINKYNLSFEKLVGYARYYKNNDVYKKLSEIAIGVV